MIFCVIVSLPIKVGHTQHFFSCSINKGFNIVVQAYWLELFTLAYFCNVNLQASTWKYVLKAAINLRLLLVCPQMERMKFKIILCSAYVGHASSTCCGCHFNSPILSFGSHGRTVVSTFAFQPSGCEFDFTSWQIWKMNMSCQLSPVWIRSQEQVLG